MLRGEREFRDPMDATPHAVRQRGGQTEWGSTSPLEAHAPWLLKLIAEHPDVPWMRSCWLCTSMVSRAAAARSGGSSTATRSALRKSRCARRNKSGRMWYARAALDARPRPI